MTQVYFVLGTPGTSVVFLSQLLGLFVNAKSAYGSTVNQMEWLNEPEGPITTDFFYDNITVTGHFPRIFSVAAKPDFEKLRTRFPKAKFVVITHTLSEIPYMSNYFYDTYYKNFSETGSEDFYRDILRTHSHLFSNIDANPEDLTITEEETFKKILQYQKLLDGYTNITEPETESLIHVPYSDIRFQKQKVLEKFSNFIKVDIPETAINYYNQILENFSSSSVSESNK
jgi:hypothetical protein